MMSEDLILHKATRAQLQQFLARPAHALLLAGPTGIGKMAVAEMLAAILLDTPVSSHPYYLTIKPDGASISIETIRELQKFLLLKTVGKKPLRRAIIIEQAQALTTEAQNAFLKLLEEPPSDTLLILTASSPRALLPTILSRTQTITINAPTKDELQPMLHASGKDEHIQKQAYFLSGGLPGLLHALLHEEEHPLTVSVAQAKDVLRQPLFERLGLADALSKQKEQALGVTGALERIAQAGLAGASAKQDISRIQQWQKVRKAALTAQNALRRSANAKLVLTDLFLRLG